LNNDLSFKQDVAYQKESEAVNVFMTYHAYFVPFVFESFSGCQFLIMLP